jgi:hypothetical protein
LLACAQGLHLKDMTDDPEAHILDVVQVNFATGCMITVSASRAMRYALLLCSHALRSGC